MIQQACEHLISREAIQDENCGSVFDGAVA